MSWWLRQDAPELVALGVGRQIEVVLFQHRLGVPAFQRGLADALVLRHMHGEKRVAENIVA